MNYFFIFGYNESESGSESSSESSTEATSDAKFTQDDLNRINKKERLAREAAEAKAKELESILEKVKNQNQMTQAEKDELAAKLEEIEKSKMTEEQKRQLEIDRLKKKYEEELNNTNAKYTETQQKLNDLLITREITEAAMSGKIVAVDGTGTQVLLVLKQSAVVDEEGQVIVKNFTWSEGGKTITEDLPAKEAVAKMKDMESWSNFWKDPANPGWKNHIQGGNVSNIDFSKLTQTQYRELRKAGKIPWAKTGDK